MTLSPGDAMPVDHYRRLCALALLVALPACSDPASEQSAYPTQFSPGGGKGGTVTVSSAIPSYGSQGEVAKQVTITGSGFDPGATVEWQRNGVRDARIEVSSVEYVSSNQLNATISIAEDAELSLYDIAVKSGRKQGIGTEMFEVVTKGGAGTEPTPSMIFPNSGASVTGDGKFLMAGGASIYSNGVCGVQTVAYTHGSGDATLETDNGMSKKRSCSSYPRQLRFNWPDAPAEVSTARVNVGALGGTGGIYAMQLGETRSMPLNINHISSRRCVMLKFRDYYLGDPAQPSVGGRDVIVFRENPKTWHVTTPAVAAGESTAECKKPDGTFEPIRLSVSFTVMD
jgi:hypothetical protein